MAGDAIVDDISNLIRLKEQELHEIHEIRTRKLEQVIEDRDRLLVECNSKFEKLKEDFQYNFSLLEARDREIKRLDDIIRNLSSELSRRESDKKELVSQLESIRAEQIKANEHLSEEKANHKVYW